MLRSTSPLALKRAEPVAAPAGRHLEAVKLHFEPMMRFDALCHLRLSSELSLRAKGLLMLRENERRRQRSTMRRTPRSSK